MLAADGMQVVGVIYLCAAGLAASLVYAPLAALRRRWRFRRLCRANERSVPQRTRRHG